MERTLCFGSLPGRLTRSGFSALVPQEKVIFLDESFIDRACSVKIAGHYPLFFFFCPRLRIGPLKKHKLAETQERAWPISRHLDLTLGQKRIYVERISRFFQHVARSLSSAVNFPGLRGFVIVVFLLRSLL